MEVPGAHAVDITVRLLEPGHLEEAVIQLRFSKSTASLESWIFVGPFEKKLEKLFSFKKTLPSDNLPQIAGPSSSSLTVIDTQTNKTNLILHLTLVYTEEECFSRQPIGIFLLHPKGTS